jgi:Ni/Fe-hydrogenase 1 B-type cytochrome subunit
MTSGDASDSYWFGTNRFIHFAAGYVLLANFVFRIYWSGTGNKYASWKNFVPHTIRQMKELIAVIKSDILQIENKEVPALGHNSVAYFTYTGTGLLTLFQVVTGFALYAPMSNAWFPQLFTWVLPIFGSDATLHLWHYAVMWLFTLFIFVHVYLCIYHDYVEGHGVLSSIIGGWKFVHRDIAAAPDAPGMSLWPPHRMPSKDKTPGSAATPKRSSRP